MAGFGPAAATQFAPGYAQEKAREAFCGFAIKTSVSVKTLPYVSPVWLVAAARFEGLCLKWHDLLGGIAKCSQEPQGSALKMHENGQKFNVTRRGLGSP